VRALTVRPASRENRRLYKSILHVVLAVLGSGAAIGMAAGGTVLVQVEQTVQLGRGNQAVAHVPQGYRLEYLASLDGPRLLTFAPNGDLFAGSKSGKIYRLPPPYTRAEVLVSLDDYPHSVAFRKDEILIARTSGLYRAPYRPGQKTIALDDVKLLAPLPGGGGHNSRTVKVGPDGRVYVSLGISGNFSDQYLGEPYTFDDRRGGILVLREGQSGKPVWDPFGTGLRNPVGFAWHPQTGELYASNNGPDHLGFEQPPEYFNRVTAGSFHGMPWFQYDGRKVIRDDCVKSKPPRPIADVVAPVVTFPARNAPMDVTFVTAGALEKQLEGNAIVALRGSWGTKPGGGFFGPTASRRPPKLVMVYFDKGKARRVEDLITGFQMQDGERWARPVGVAIGPDGVLYFTSDSGSQGLFRLKPDR